MKRFVIVVDGLPRSDLNAITRHFKTDSDVRFWHYVKNVWFITDAGDRRAGWWRRKLSQLTETESSTRLIVSEVTVQAWSAHGPKVMLPWLHKRWRTKEDSSSASSDSDDEDEE